MQVIPETMDKNTKLHPDHQWVQCDSCLKWRVLPDGWNSDEMEGDWFCYMEPYCGSCNDAEVMPGNDVFTIEVKRGGGILHPPHGNGSDVSMVANGGKLSLLHSLEIFHDHVPPEVDYKQIIGFLVMISTYFRGCPLH
jgi:hypothetical protein